MLLLLRKAVSQVLSKGHCKLQPGKALRNELVSVSLRRVGKLRPGKLTVALRHAMRQRQHGALEVPLPDSTSSGFLLYYLLTPAGKRMGSSPILKDGWMDGGVSNRQLLTSKGKVKTEEAGPKATPAVDFEEQMSL